MTEAQKASVLHFLGNFEDPLTRGPVDFELGHGLCIGADVQAHAIARKLVNCKGIWGFPAKNVGAKSVKLPPNQFLIMAPPKLPLVRNMDIVLWCEILLATPKEDHMVTRSGTWTTVRYALAEERPVHVVLPNGVIKLWEAVEW